MKTNQERFPDATIGSDVVIGPRATIKSRAYIESGAYIRSGAKVVAHTDGTYHWNTYDDLRSGVSVKVLRYGCVTLPIAVWMESLDALCFKHDNKQEVRVELETILAGAANK